MVTFFRRDCDIPLREPVVTPPGKRFIQIDGPSNEESYLATVFRFAEGQELGDDMSLQSAYKWGKLTATFIDMLRHYRSRGAQAAKLAPPSRTVNLGSRLLKKSDYQGQPRAGRHS